MFKSKLEQFMLKRAAYSLLLLLILDFAVLKDGRWPVLVGLLAGALLSAARFGGRVLVFCKLPGANPVHRAHSRALAGSIALFSFNELILLPLLLLTYFLGHWIFAGFAAGILLVPAVVMINSVTEAFGITQNSFE